MLAQIEIEQVTGGDWVGRVEVGGMTAKRRVVHGGTFGAVMAAVMEAYETIAPPDAVASADFAAVRPALDALAPPLPPRERAKLPPLRDTRGV